ncbi:MAG: hypothetical protein JWR26_2073 [Pedosphaera sp.]|nr:hypothetical protein [Pedosphaera sp.]
MRSLGLLQFNSPPTFASLRLCAFASKDHDAILKINLKPRQTPKSNKSVHKNKLDNQPTSPAFSTRSMDAQPPSTSSPAKVHVARGLALLLLLGITFATILVLRHSKATDKSRHTTLPDGTTVELLGTSIGNATFTTDKPWQRFARHWLPSRLQNWLPAVMTMNCSPGANGLTVYLRVTGLSATPGTPFPWNGCMAEDETGLRYARESGMYTYSPATGFRCCGMTLRSFPRRQSDFLFHLVDQNGAVIGSLRVPNPLRGPYPEWRPQPLPQIQTNGPVTITLSGMQAQLKPPWPHIEPKWRVTSEDKRWINSRVRFQNFLDATGNEGQMLPQNEPAWKLRATVFRERLKLFAPDEMMTLTNLDLPASGNFISIDQSNTCAGVAIKVLLLAGAGQLTITNGGARAMTTSSSVGYSHSSSSGSIGSTETWDSSNPFFLVEAQNIQPDDDILVRVIDETGHATKAESSMDSTQPNGARIYLFSITPPNSAKTLAVEVLVNRPLKFEFMVNPADARPPKP